LIEHAKAFARDNSKEVLDHLAEIRPVLLYEPDVGSVMDVAPNHVL